MVFPVAFAAICVCIPLAGLDARAQTFDATSLREPADLGAKWLVHAGDDPAYARTDFDDSQWTLFDPSTSITKLFPQTKPDVIWYRLRVKVDRSQTGLALKEFEIARAFEIYVNGEKLIASGRVSPFAPYTADARLSRRIPDRLLATGTLVIALRVHISSVEWTTQNPGFDSSNLTIGQERTIYRYDWLSIIGQNALDWLGSLLLTSLGLVAIVLYISQRRQTEYLWIFALGALTFLQLPARVITTFQNIPMAWEVAADMLRIFHPYIYVSLYFSFVHQRIGWRWRIFLVFAGIDFSLSALQGVIFPVSVAYQMLESIPYLVLLSVVIPIVLVRHLRRGNREAGILLIPDLLLSLYIYAELVLGTMFQIPVWRSAAIQGFNLIERFPAGPFSISLDDVSGILSVFSLAIIILLRSTSMSRRQTQLEGELAAAQEVQQILVPEHAESVPGFTVESIYQPAQQVGGDFFQILPDSKGGLLVVVGDVAGKGLPAAMMVSVLVGAIRGIAEYRIDPSELLANLNDQLIGRTQASFSTALAAHIAADGIVTIANAGHLSPYLDGREVELPGALPLGIVPHARYESNQFHLASGSRLTFYSDGVVEARNQNGELFGFERGKAMSTKPAAAIVQAAKEFGQEDDITVVAIARHAALASAA
jgi:phosphoserine phosphatase RsbU/P